MSGETIRAGSRKARRARHKIVAPPRVTPVVHYSAIDVDPLAPTWPAPSLEPIEFAGGFARDEAAVDCDDNEDE